MGDEPIKVLLIEDSIFATRHAQKMLDKAKSALFNAELKCVDRLSDGLDHLAQARVDIVLLDLTLPDSDELDTFTKVHNQAPEVPIVVLTGLEDETLAIEAVKKGAQDYLVKGQVGSNMLKRSILYATERKRAEEELRKHREHLEDLVDQRTAELRKSYEQIQLEVSERKRAEETLRESEGRYRSLTDDVLDSSAVAIFILDSDFRIVWVNQSLENYFGLRRSELVGKDKRQLIRERIRDIFEDPERFTKKVFATYDNNTYIENFECHVLPDGERKERWLEHWSRPIQSGLYAGGRIEHYYDINERKQAEEELRKHRDHLEQLVEERTAELRKMVNLMAGREVRMAELKDAIKKLRAQIESAGLAPVADDPIKEVGSEK